MKTKFTKIQRRQILERDGNRCVFCGRGDKESRLYVGYIMPPQKPESETNIDNGQVLCGEHNASVSRHGTLGAAVYMFADLSKKSTSLGDSKLKNFCKEISQSYNRHKT